MIPDFDSISKVPRNTSLLIQSTVKGMHVFACLPVEMKMNLEVIGLEEVIIVMTGFSFRFCYLPQFEQLLI